MNVERRRFEIHTDYEGITIVLYVFIDGQEYDAFRYGLKKGQSKLAHRLGRAWVDGAIGKDLILLPKMPSVGGLFVSTKPGTYMPIGRTLNADLRKVGY